MTVVAKLRRIPGAKGDGLIASTTAWRFGVKEDGSLYFTITGKGWRKSVPTEHPEVAPLSVPMKAKPPLENLLSGRVPEDIWTTVAWAVNTKGTWAGAFTFFINGVAQSADQGWGPLDANPSEGSVKFGGGSSLELAEVRLYGRHLRIAEIAELANTGKISTRPSETKSEPIEKQMSPENNGRMIFAHRMIGFGPSFAGNPDRNNFA
ncbi:MAG: hypothetical protein WC637_06355, partial [Victivallales bacterium]